MEGLLGRDLCYNLRAMISEQEMRDALVRSGYLLEQRMHHMLEEEGFYVEANTAYPDEFTGKSRELDIDAVMAIDLRAGDMLFVEMVCSCVNNSQPLAFFMQESRVPFMHHQQLKMSGLPVQVYDASNDGDFLPLSEFLLLERYHHYCQPRISSQYCGFAAKKSAGGSKKQEWMATHLDEHHESLNPLGVAIEALISREYEAWQLDGAEPIYVTVYYPVLILQGDLHEIETDGSELTISASDHVLFRHTYHSAHRRDQYFIDVVREAYFPNYLETLKNETERMARAMIRRKRLLRESIERLVRRAKRRSGRQKKSIRQAFEWQD